MKNNKGFTLIELLAVIVILAILMLIAMPNALKIMKNAKKEAFRTEAVALVKAAKNYYMANIDSIKDKDCFYLANPNKDNQNDLQGYYDKKDGYDGSVCIDLSNTANPKYTITLDNDNESLYFWNVKDDEIETTTIRDNKNLLPNFAEWPSISDIPGVSVNEQNNSCSFTGRPKIWSDFIEIPANKVGKTLRYTFNSNMEIGNSLSRSYIHFYSTNSVSSFISLSNIDYYNYLLVSASVPSNAKYFRIVIYSGSTATETVTLSNPYAEYID